jgi:hypothetical protein
MHSLWSVISATDFWRRCDQRVQLNNSLIAAWKAAGVLCLALHQAVLLESRNGSQFEHVIQMNAGFSRVMLAVVLLGCCLQASDAFPHTCACETPLQYLHISLKLQ